MEDLNQKQMILLTMFTSFVISIATGIITVAMLQVAPETITQTVNHVVEHTIERIVTGSSTPERQQQPSVVTNNVTKEVTVYAKEDDLVVSAVEKNQPRVATIFAGTGENSEPIALGFVASRDGLVITDAKGLLGDAPTRDSYRVTIGGKGYSAVPVVGQDTGKPLFFLKLTSLTATSSMDSVTYGRGDPKAAQTVVVLGGIDGTSIFKATLSKLRYAKPEATSTSQILNGIETSPRIAEQNLGAPVVDLDGQLVGIVIPDPTDSTRSYIYPLMRILENINAIPSQSSNSATTGKGGG